MCLLNSIERASLIGESQPPHLMELDDPWGFARKVQKNWKVLYPKE
jgi:hypothetical protein